MKKKQSSQDATPERNCGSVGEIEIDPFEDTSWVFVKKQRVNILLPPQSVSEGCLVQDAGPRGALDGAADGRTPAGNACPQGVSHSPDMSSREIEDSKKLGELSALRINRAVKSCSPFRKISRQSRAGGPRASKTRVELLNRKDAPAELTTPIGDSQLQTYAHSTVPPPNKIEASKEFDEYLTLGINTSIKTRSTCTSRNFHQEGIAGAPCVFADGPEPLSRQLRTRNLKRKLEEADGLAGWLLSMGLVQFVKIFEHKPMNEFHLASLTTPKLKEMGAAAVGLRTDVSNPCPAALKHHAFHLYAEDLGSVCLGQVKPGMESMIKKYQQKFRKAKEEMERWSEIQAQFISQFNNASSIIERLPIIRKKENFGALNCVDEIMDAVLSKQLQSLQSILLSMGTILEEFRAVVLSLEKILRDSGEFIRGRSSQLNAKQLQQQIGLKPSLANCLDGLKLLYDMHFAEFRLKSSIVSALPLIFFKSSITDLSPLRQLLVDQPNIPPDEVQSILDIIFAEEIC